MTTFFFCAAFMIICALVILLTPFFRSRTSHSADWNIATIDAYRSQFEEIESDSLNGELALSGAEKAKQDIKRRLLADVGRHEVSMPAGFGHQSKWLASSAIVLSVVLAAFIYGINGNPAAINLEKTPRKSEHRLTRDEIQLSVEKLGSQLRDAPNDLDAWVLLARSQLSLGDVSAAASAYDAAVSLAPRRADLLADYADVLALKQGKRFDGEPDAIIARALREDPRHLKALALAGTSALAKRNYVAAIEHWQRALGVVPPDSPQAGSLRTNIEQAESVRAASTPQKMATSGASATIRGVVELAPSLLSEVSANDTVFVFARQIGGGRQPIAAARLKADRWPALFELNDSMALNQANRLSALKLVQLEAKVSKMGNATAVSGDFVSVPIQVSVGSHDVRIRISETRQ